MEGVAAALVANLPKEHNQTYSNEQKPPKKIGGLNELGFQLSFPVSNPYGIVKKNFCREPPSGTFSTILPS